MPPPNKLGMRDPQPMTKKPFNPWKAVDESINNKAEHEKLKSPKTVPPPPASKTPPNGSKPPQFTYHVEHQEVFNKIKTRLTTFYPPICLENHIVHSWEKIEKLKDYAAVKTYRNVLNGIDFVTEDREKFVSAVRNTMAGQNKAFVEGNNNDWKKHWALTLSFLATDGVGFREVFRPKVVERPIENPNNIRFDSRLGKDVTVDVSALHIAVADFPELKQGRCNIHIDEMTVTLAGIGEDVRISPTVISHFVNELLFKTKLQGKLPDWIIDAFDISLLNPNEGFLSAGIGATIINKPNFQWTIKYSAGLNNSTNPEWSGNFKFEHSVGTSIVVRF